MLRELTQNELAAVSGGISDVEAVPKLQNTGSTLALDICVGGILGLFVIGSPLMCIMGFTRYRHFHLTQLTIGAAIGSVYFALSKPINWKNPPKG